MKLALCRLTLVLMFAVAITSAAHAQLGCATQSQSALLGQFSDNAPAGSIQPSSVRNVICSGLNVLQNLADVAQTWLARQNLNAQGRAVNTADLRSKSTADYPDGIIRETDGTAGAPPLGFMPDTGGVCSADDIGHCVAANGGGFWLSQPNGPEDVREWSVSTAATDNSVAFQAALTAALANNLVLYIPPGTFNFTNPVSGTIPGGQSFTLYGAGQDVTILKYTGSAGLITLNYTNEHSGFTNSDMTYLANSAGAGIAVNLIQLNTNIANEAGSAFTSLARLTFRGGLGAGTTNYWTTAFSEQGISNIDFNADTVFLGTTGTNGDAFSLAGLSNLSQSVALNFHGINVAGGRYGIIYGSWVQGVTVTYSNFDEQMTNIIINSAGGGDGLTVSTSQFGLNSGNTIDCLGVLNSMMIGGSNLFTSIPAGFSGININSTSCGIAAKLNNNTMTGSGANATGISVVADHTGRTDIQGNTFETNIGINLSSGLSGTITVGVNTYNDSTDIIDNNTGTIYSNTQLVAGTSGSVAVVGGGGNVFFSIGPTGSATENNVAQLTTISEVINITGCRSVAPGTGQSVTYTLRTNNTSSGLTCTVSGTNNAGIVAGTPVTIPAQTIWDIMATPSATAASGSAKWEGTIRPTP